MFTPEFIEQLTDAIAAKVIERLELHAEKQSGLSEWLDRYGPMMTRKEAAQALKVSERTVYTLEERGKIVRLNVAGKYAKYETASIFKLVTNNQRYAK